MSLHQYRLISDTFVTNGMREHMPNLISFLKNRYGTRTKFDPMFAHELAHVMEIFERGQIHRLKLPNLGWPADNFSTFTAKSASIECKVFAMQWILEEMFTGSLNSDDLLSFNSVALFLNSPRFWSKKDEFHGWASERSPAHRLQDAVREYKPKTKELLNATVDYMVDECAEFL